MDETLRAALIEVEDSIAHQLYCNSRPSRVTCEGSTAKPHLYQEATQPCKFNAHCHASRYPRIRLEAAHRQLRSLLELDVPATKEGDQPCAL